ncbi:MAG: PD-(D/E)XK nuclease family protein [Segatella copri]|nr:PD-(D/E)XK nuclease family protein [Segatella copri]
MDLKAIQQLLQEAQPILQKSKAEMKEREAKGEYFNVFENLHFTRPEEHLHTPFLRMLLDKDANHGVGKGFLEAFLKMVKKELKLDFQYDVNSSHVEYKDKHIGEVKISEKDGESTGGDIDIFLYDEKGHAIIIENKFDRYGNSAQDQPRQLERYHNFGKKEYKDNFILIYLTPSGQDASKYSTGPNKITYYPMSYDLSDDKPNILSWLKKCLDISKGCPRIHEVIKQYITFIKDTRHIMEENYQKELLNLLLSEENVDVTLGILRDGQKIKEKIRRDFCNQLEKLAGEYGLELREQYDGNIATWNSDYGWMIFVGKKRHQSQVGFVVGNFSRPNSKKGGMLYGLSIINGDYSNLEELKHKFKIESGNPDDEYPKFSQEKEPSQLSEGQWKDFPWGFSYLTDENREWKKNWYDWDDLQTLADMRNGKMLDFMRTRFEILKNNGIIDKL